MGIDSLVIIGILLLLFMALIFKDGILMKNKNQAPADRLITPKEYKDLLKEVKEMKALLLEVLTNIQHGNIVSNFVEPTVSLPSLDESVFVPKVNIDDLEKKFVTAIASDTISEDETFSESTNKLKNLKKK